MNSTLVMVAVLAAVAMLSMTTAYADISNTDTDDTSSTHVEPHSKQSIVASGTHVFAQNCAENNVDSRNTAGDEGLDCHNNQAESTEQNASD
jgi:hypothetical protein